ncbi:MAG: UvrD-helicase domain-containing protein, partial [Oscillospiraceae bacterium]
ERLLLFTQAKAPAQSVWGKILFAHAAQQIAAAAAQCAAALALLDDNAALEPYRPALAAYGALFDALGVLCEDQNWDGLFDALQGFEHPRLSAARRAAPEDREQIKQRRDRIKDTVLRLRERLFDATELQFADDIADLTPKISRLFELVRRTDVLLSEKKRTAGIIDFSDLEQLSVELLMRRTEQGDQPTELAVQYAARYDEIMVDEYQDVNGAQDMILTALSNGNNLFLVGDVKQSVYRFRQARPELFLDRAASYPDYDKDAPRFPAKIALNGNFRSRQEITDVINQTFFALMRREAAELDYDASQALVPMAAYPPQSGCGVELHLLDPDTLPDDAIAAEREAEYAAERVSELLRSGFPVTDGGARRPIEPRDICILLRSPKSRARLYRQALADAGVESTVDSPGEFLSSAEITAVCNLLHVIDNPTRDLELAGAMLSPLLGFTDDELASIRLGSPSGSL